MKKGSTIEYHSYSEAWKRLDDGKFKELKESIRDIGLIQPIVLFKDKILDGRHRYEACLEVEVDPEFIDFEGTDDQAVKVCHAANALGRSKSKSEIAAAAVFLHKLNSNFVYKNGTKKKSRNKKGKGNALENLASEHGVSSSLIEQANTLQNQSPENFDEVLKGEKSIKKAFKELKSKDSEEVIEKAINRVGNVCGSPMADAIRKGVLFKNKKELIKYAELEDDEMLRIRGLVQEGWTVSKSQHYKMAALCRTHKIKDLLDRARSQESTFILEMEGFIITVERKKGK